MKKAILVGMLVFVACSDMIDRDKLPGAAVYADQQGVQFEWVVASFAEPDIQVFQVWVKGDKQVVKEKKNMMIFEGKHRVSLYLEKSCQVRRWSLPFRKGETIPRRIREGIALLIDSFRKGGLILAEATGRLKGNWPGQLVREGVYNNIRCQVWESKTKTEKGNFLVTTWLPEDQNFDHPCQIIILENERVAYIHQIRNIKSNIEISEEVFSLPSEATFYDVDFPEVFEGFFKCPSSAP